MESNWRFNVWKWGVINPESPITGAGGTWHLAARLAFPLVIGGIEYQTLWKYTNPLVTIGYLGHLSLGDYVNGFTVGVYNPTTSFPYGYLVVAD